MKILIFHPVLLPPKDYGGIERVVLWLAKGLRDLGHEVSVAALQGSQLPDGVRLVEVSPGDRSATSFFKKSSGVFDVVHFMAPPENESLPLISLPWLLTIHGNGKPGEVFPKNTLFLSKNHAMRHQRRSYVYNGIDPLEYQFSAQAKSDRFLFLSKTSWKVKNVLGALSIANHAQVSLTVAGGWRPFCGWFKTLFSRHQWVGPVNGEHKKNLLTESAGFLFPVLWDEPFGLVVIEAMASGLPVFASSKGSLPELITPETGILLDPIQPKQWIEPLQNVKRWNREACRERVIKYFTHHTMAQNYLEYYKKAIAGETWT